MQLKFKITKFNSNSQMLKKYDYIQLEKGQNIIDNIWIR